MTRRMGELLAWSRVSAAVSARRREGKTIVTTNGAFDLLHVGHVRYLAAASAQGDVLVVGINSDAATRKIKGPHRPVNPQRHRAEVLLAMRAVDYVVIFDDVVPMPFIELVRPDVHVNGAEYGRDCIEAATVARVGGRLHLLPRDGELSSSSIVQRIVRGSRHARSAPQAGHPTTSRA